MKEYLVVYRLNGVQDNYFVTVSQTDLPFREIRFSIISTLKTNLSIKPDDKLEIIDIQEYK
jgi:hypothetical protein